jgi:hypothetical protein
MGWASGSSVFEDIYRSIRPLIPAKNRKLVVKKLVDAFEGADCDTLDEVRGQWDEVDDVLAERYPEDNE